MKPFSWSGLPKPFFVLAPMEGATDTVFRQMVLHCGKPDVVVTEFTNVEGLFSKGADHVSHRLQFTNHEHPIVAQVWGTTPELFTKAAKLIVKMGFDGIDINMGCPDRAVVKGGACSALIHDHDRALEIITATKKGAGDLPISVKTRIGFGKNQIDTWIAFLLKQKLAAITIHLRTVKEQSLVPAHWELAKDIVTLKNSIAPETIIIGNGDVASISDGTKKVQESGMDGIMIGRGAFHNPYVFNKDIDYSLVSKEEKIVLLAKHLDLFDTTWSGKKVYAPLKRFFKIYIKDFDGASELREKLMSTESVEEARKCLKSLESNHT